MKLSTVFAALAAVVLAAPVVALAGVSHPRLFVTEQRIKEIRAAIARGGHHGEAFELMKKRVEKDGLEHYGNPKKYARSYKAREAAMCYLITGDKRYAQLSFDTIKSIYEDSEQERKPHKGYGLSRAMMGLGLAIPYDWCYPGWTQEQRDYVKDKGLQALDAWPGYGHANFRHPKVSNWVAVCRGGELVLMLAMGEEKNRQDRYKMLVSHLRTHMQFGFGDLGVSQEGIGYTEYPGGFLLPAVFATKDLGDDTLWNEARKHAWWTMAMYTHAFQGRDRKFLMTGVAGTSGFNEGWASLLLNLCPEKDRPYFLYWYDRHMGVKSNMAPDVRYDGERAGTVWALIYYPEDAQAKDPTGVYPIGVADSHGFYFFRNRWKDENDILSSVMADTVHHSHAWDQPEVAAINLMAYNSRFIGGPSKKRDDKLYSTLLVDGKYNIDKSVNYPGKKVHFEADKDSAYAVVGGGKLYEKLGVKNLHRHVYSKMNTDVAIISTLDRVESDAEHTYTWQANLGDESGDGNLKMKTATEGGRPTFTLLGANGYVKGWVVTPGDVDVEAASDPLRLSFKGANANLWVVMLVGPGASPPKAQISGSGLESVFKIGGASIRFDEKTDRITGK